MNFKTIACHEYQSFLGQIGNYCKLSLAQTSSNQIQCCHSELQGAAWKSWGIVSLELHGSESELESLNSMLRLMWACLKADNALFHTTLSYQMNNSGILTISQI